MQTRRFGCGLLEAHVLVLALAAAALAPAPRALAATPTKWMVPAVPPGTAAYLLRGPSHPQGEQCPEKPGCGDACLHERQTCEKGGVRVTNGDYDVNDQKLCVHTGKLNMNRPDPLKTWIPQEFPAKTQCYGLALSNTSWLNTYLPPFKQFVQDHALPFVESLIDHVFWKCVDFLTGLPLNDLKDFALGVIEMLWTAKELLVGDTRCRLVRLSADGKATVDVGLVFAAYSEKIEGKLQDETAGRLAELARKLFTPEIELIMNKLTKLLAAVVAKIASTPIGIEIAATLTLLIGGSTAGIGAAGAPAYYLLAKYALDWLVDLFFSKVSDAIWARIGPKVVAAFQGHVQWIVDQVLQIPGFTTIVNRYQDFAGQCSYASSPGKGAWTMCKEPYPSKVLWTVGGTSFLPVVNAGETVTVTGSFGLFCTAQDAHGTGFGLPCDALEQKPTHCR